MLQNIEKTLGYTSSHDEAGPDGQLDLGEIFAGIRRQIFLIVLFAILGTIASLVYVFNAKPIYVATSQILIDNKQLESVDSRSQQAKLVIDEPYILSQIELIMSEKLAVQAIDELELLDEPLFRPPPTSWTGHIKNNILWLGEQVGLVEPKIDEEPTLLDEKLRIAELIREGMSVSLKTNTFVISITYESPSPRLASKIANGMAQRYVLDQLEATFEATSQASEWLEARSAELGRQSEEAAFAVETFRKEKGLVSSEGVLLTEQQLSDLNLKLGLARSATALAQATFNRLDEIITEGDTGAIINDALDNQIIVDLRTQFLAAAKRESEISTTLGKNHQQAVRLRSEMEKFQEQIFGELARIRDGASSSLKVARAEQAAIEAQLDEVQGKNTANNIDAVKLRQLERQAATYRELHQAFLLRYQESLQNQSFPVSEARIINEAHEPEFPAFPSKGTTLVLGLLGGAMLGLIFGGMREYRDRVFRTGDQIRKRLGYEFLGYFPNINESKLREDKGESVMNYCVHNPRSFATETLRSVRLMVDLQTKTPNQAVVLAVTSSVPSEGKSTTSSNLAHLLASQGKRVLLVDADLRRPGLSKRLTNRISIGLVDVLLGETTLDKAVQVLPGTELSFISGQSTRHVNHASELISSHLMKGMLDVARQSYDFIIVDLPPVQPVVDAKAFLYLADSFYFVVHWGMTDRSVVRSSLKDFCSGSEHKCAGIVLNRVDISTLHLYQKSSGEASYSDAQAYYVDQK